MIIEGTLLLVFAISLWTRLLGFLLRGFAILSRTSGSHVFITAAIRIFSCFAFSHYILMLRYSMTVGARLLLDSQVLRLNLQTGEVFRKICARKAQASLLIRVHVRKNVSPSADFDPKALEN